MSPLPGATATGATAAVWFRCRRRFALRTPLRLCLCPSPPPPSRLFVLRITATATTTATLELLSEPLSAGVIWRRLKAVESERWTAGAGSTTAATATAVPSTTPCATSRVGTFHSTAEACNGGMNRRSWYYRRRWRSGGWHIGCGGIATPRAAPARTVTPSTARAASVVCSAATALSNTHRLQLVAFQDESIHDAPKLRVFVIQQPHLLKGRSIKTTAGGGTLHRRRCTDAATRKSPVTQTTAAGRETLRRHQSLQRRIALALCLYITTRRV